MILATNPTLALAQSCRGYERNAMQRSHRWFQIYSTRDSLAAAGGRGGYWVVVKPFLEQRFTAAG